MKIVTESPEATYRAALESGRLRIQLCGACASHVFPPRVTCPNCGKAELDWTEPKGTGTVHSCTVVNRKPDRGGPYNVVLVDLTEGVRLMSHVTGFGADDVPIDLPVRAEIEPDTNRLIFRAEGAA
tara:strand:- start:1499 stop:1876 length:378 start_codon:yes stop_codon:yes gene_type:complete